MNINYTTGDTIRNSGNPSQYIPPAQRPTEEWAGSEVRSYQNYIRPVSNLFENDGELNCFVKDLFIGLSPIRRIGEYSIISGCSCNISDRFCYVDHGAFIRNKNIYCIYPACGATAKQIETEYTERGLGSLRLTITFNIDADVKYSYSYSKNSEPTQTGTALDPIMLLQTLINALFVDQSGTPIENPPAIEDHIILPIFKASDIISKYIIFNGTKIIASDTKSSTDIIFGQIKNNEIMGPWVSTSEASPLSTIDGSRLSSNPVHKVKTSSLSDPYMYLGNTRAYLASYVHEVTGAFSINNVSLSDSSASGVNIVGNSGAAVRTKSDYTLGNACEKAFSTNTSLTETGKLPTAEAVKAYVDGQVQYANRNGTINFNKINVGNAATFRNNITADGKLIINSTDDASRAANAVSSSASIYTQGGIEAKKNIYADGDIIGRNNGTYSLRSLKENITPFKKSAIKLINDVKIVNYNYIADSEKNHKVGFIADDTDEIFATKNHNIMDQSNCIGVLLKAVQELSGEVKKLKEEINELKSNNATGGEE